jgi:hypothetical protein
MADYETYTDLLAVICLTIIRTHVHAQHAVVEVVDLIFSEYACLACGDFKP